MWLYSWITTFQTHIKDGYLEHFLWNCPEVNGTRPCWWLTKIGSDNGLWHQAASHYLNQCWPISMTLHGITSPQRVNLYIDCLWSGGQRSQDIGSHDLHVLEHPGFSTKRIKVLACIHQATSHYQDQCSRLFGLIWQHQGSGISGLQCINIFQYSCMKSCFFCLSFS